MATCAAAVLYGLFVWWFSTGAVLWIVGRCERSPRLSAALGLALLAVSTALLAATRTDAGALAAYAAFTAAILLWGAQEIAFLTGWITGPWRAPCPPGLGGWGRARYAFAAILYHEAALAASMLGVWAVAGQAENRVGAWTFAVLFGMRISAKLNVFLGVPNLTEGFLPPRLGYLTSFFARRPMNPLFPVSVTASTALFTLVVIWAAEADGVAATGYALVATLVGLALLEHWFLVLPLPVEQLWGWSLGRREPRAREPLPVAANQNAAPRFARAITDSPAVATRSD